MRASAARAPWAVRMARPVRKTHATDRFPGQMKKHREITGLIPCSDACPHGIARPQAVPGTRGPEWLLGPATTSAGRRLPVIFGPDLHSCIRQACKTCPRPLVARAQSFEATTNEHRSLGNP